MSDVGCHVNSFTALPIHLPLISGRVGRVVENLPATDRDPGRSGLRLSRGQPTTGLLICGDPALAIADKDLNSRVLALIAGMKDVEAKAALGEYARWTRNRDRKCDLDDKDNVPLARIVVVGSLPCGLYRLQDRRDRRGQRRPQEGLWTVARPPRPPMRMQLISVSRRFTRPTRAAIFCGFIVSCSSTPRCRSGRPW